MVGRRNISEEFIFSCLVEQLILLDLGGDECFRWKVYSKRPRESIALESRDCFSIGQGKTLNNFLVKIPLSITPKRGFPSWDGKRKSFFSQMSNMSIGNVRQLQLRSMDSITPDQGSKAVFH